MYAYVNFQLSPNHCLYTKIMRNSQRNIQNRTGTFVDTDAQLQTRKTNIVIIITTTIIASIILYLYKLQNKT